MKRKQFTFLVAALMVVSACFGMPSYANSNASYGKIVNRETSIIDESKPEQIFRSNGINELSETQNISGELLDAVKSSPGEFDFERDNMEVTVSNNVKEGILLKDSDANVNLNIQVEDIDFRAPKIIDNSIVYESKTDDVLLGVDVMDGGVRQTFILKNPDAEKTFAINYNAKNIGYLNFAYMEDGTTDGSVVIYDKNGEIIAGIEAPWAKDKNGNDVKTHYEINGTELIQVVEPEEENEYPIIADPLTYSSFFKSSKWIWRKNSDYKRSLSIEPKWASCGYAAGLSAWPYLKKKHDSSKYWKNTGGLKDQFLCHANFAQKWKTPWNIEPGRPNVSYVKTVAHGCNPK